MLGTHRLTQIDKPTGKIARQSSDACDAGRLQQNDIARSRVAVSGVMLFVHQAPSNRYDQRHSGIDLVLGAQFTRVDILAGIVSSRHIAYGPLKDRVTVVFDTNTAHRGIEFHCGLTEILSRCAELDHR